MSKTKIDTKVLSNAGAPEALSFEEMKKMVIQFKALQKQIKALPKADRALLMPKRERVISENIKKMVSDISDILSEYQENIVSEFKTTVSAEKPEGQRWLTWKLEDYTFCLAINKAKKG